MKKLLPKILILEHMNKQEYWWDYISKLIINKRISVENYAENMHKIWSNWYTHQRDNSTPENIERWNNQSKTDYQDLSEEDKEKDRDIIRKYFIT